MAKHDQTRDGGRPSEQVDPSKIVRPKDDEKGKHGSSGSGSAGNPDDDRPDDDKK